MNRKTAMNRHSTSRGHPKRVKPLAPPLKMEAIPGRNELCHCGSGKKYKRCCLFKDKLTRNKTRLIATDITHFGQRGAFKRHETGEYIVTSASIPLNLSEDEKIKISHYYNLLNSSSQKLDAEVLEEIIAFQKEHNEIPQSWNLLSAAYHAAEEKELADKLISETYEKFPKYFFAKLNVALHWIYKNDLEKAGELLEGKENVKQFEPSQDEFHISAVENFHYATVLYYLEKGDIEKAKEHRKTLNILISSMGSKDNSTLTTIDKYIAQAEELAQEN